MIAGLGGRAITRRSLRALLDAPRGGRASTPLHFLDLRPDVVERELDARPRAAASGPHAENILRELGIVAAGPV